MPAGLGRYPSGQRGQTVNLLAYAFGGSNPPLPTIVTNAACAGSTVGGLSQTRVVRPRALMHRRGNSSAVERQPSKLGVAGSNPVSRSTLTGSACTTWECEAAGRSTAEASLRESAGGLSKMRVAAYFGAHVAQSAERVLGKDEVSGSIPDMGSTSRLRGAVGDGR